MPEQTAQKTEKPNDFRPLRQRLRATFSAAELGASLPHVATIDEDKGVLSGIQITLEGEAKGHGIFLDREFCDAVVSQGNALKAGLKCRFGHPAMCSDALGTYLGRLANFRTVDLKRKDGSAACGVLADLTLAEEAKLAPSGDLYKWTLSAAKNSPDTFGQSIVFTYDDLKVIDAAGKSHSRKDECGDKPEQKFDEWGNSKKERGESWRDQSADGHIYAVLGQLLGSDFTDTPAATDGVFSADSLAAQADEMLAEFPEVAGLLASKPSAVAEFLARHDDKLAAGVFAALASALSPEALKAALPDATITKRVAGLQKAKDEEISALRADLSGQVKTLSDQLAAARKELAEALASASALKAAGETGAKVLAEVREQLYAAQSAHAALTAGVLTVPGSDAARVDSFSAFAAKHGGSIAKAIAAEPEIYKRLCSASGIKPLAIS